jgi:flavin-dependent dehydrogenase
MRHAQPIKILGAGPAGLMAALTLARAGRRVAIYERAADVGTRHDGDLEAVENWTIDTDVCAELAQWGLGTNFRCVPFHTTTYFGPGFRHSVEVCDSQPLFYAVQRGPLAGSIDRGLLEQARAAGVEVLFNQPAQPHEVDIVAGGFTRARAYAVGYNFTTNAPNGSYVCFDDTLTPHVYSYLILCDGQGTVAAGAITPRQGMRPNLDRVLEGFRTQIGFSVRSPRYFAASVTFGVPETAQREGRLYVGEAADFQDPFCGFGMRMSMTTGYLAARSLLDGTDYDQAWRARYLGLLRTAAVNRMAQQLVGNLGYRLAIPFIRHHARAARSVLRFLYASHWYTACLWPIARRRLEAERRRQNIAIRNPFRLSTIDDRR